MTSYFSAFLPEFFLVLGLSSSLIVGLSLRCFLTLNRFSAIMLIQLVSILVGALICLLSTGKSETRGFFECFYFCSFFFDSASIFTLAKVAFIVLSIACILIHWPRFSSHRMVTEYCFIILVVTFAAFLLISSRNLGVAFLCLEMQTLALLIFIKIGPRPSSGLVAEVSFRYFANAAFASVVLLFGISGLYLVFGSLDVDVIRQTELVAFTAWGRVFTCALFVMVLFSVFFKLTLAPFHHWVGDLYEGTPGYVGSYFALVTKIPVWILLLKILSSSEHFIGQYLVFVQLIGVLSIFIGNLSAFTETTFRRFWALGSVGHMGQILLAVLTFSIDNINIACFYLFLYLSANILFWAFLLGTVNSRPNFEATPTEFFNSIFRTAVLRGKRTFSPLLLFLLLSLAGLPPAFGFFAKFYFFSSLLTTTSVALFFIVFVGNLPSIAYYIRLIRFLSFEADFNQKLLREDHHVPDPLLSVTVYGLVLVFWVHSFFGFGLIYYMLFSILHVA